MIFKKQVSRKGNTQVLITCPAQILQGGSHSGVY